MDYRTARDLNFAATRIYPAFTLPAGSAVKLIMNADGIKGDLFALESARQLADLTGNSHDPKYRYLWLEAADVVRADGTPAAADLNKRA